MIGFVLQASNGASSNSVELPSNSRYHVDASRDRPDAGHISAKRTSVSPNPAAEVQSRSSRGEPVSLAAFIGGRATGPRLNKRAVQQDVHDPTQFEQRTTISTP